MPAKKHRTELTATAITKLKAPVTKPGKSPARLWVADSIVPGFGVRVTDKGVKTFVLRTRYPGESSASRREIGQVGTMELADAREKARSWLKLIAKGKDPADAEEEQRRAQIRKGATTVNAVLDAFEKDHVEGLRSGDQVKAAFNNHVRPRIGDRSIYDLKRSDISAMLNEIAAGIEAESRKANKTKDGKVMADRVLAHLRKAFNWQMIQDDDFKSPIVRGMAKTKPKQRARKRILVDDEIRDVWSALDTAPDLPGCFSAYVRSLMLCATRRNEAARMTSAELDGDLWTIPADRYKTKLDHVIPLSRQARALIGEKPDGFKGNVWFIFSNATGGNVAGAKPFAGFTKAKRALDSEIARVRKAEGREPMSRWTLHDLRRTARSLMSRAKVPADHAERAIGHVIGGVRETYDRYEYLDEKRAAFEALASMLDMILKPPTNNVVPMRTEALS